MAPPDELFVLLRRFARTMAHSFEVNDLLYELCDHAVAVLGASGAGVSVVGDDDRLRFVTATNAQVLEIERSQEDRQEGPCVTAFLTSTVVVVPDVGALTRWPEYRAVAEAVGMHAILGVPLSLGDRGLGAMNVYNGDVRVWSEEDLAVAQVLADMATAYLVRAGELDEARQLSRQLQEALDSRIVIEQAKGMLARDHDVPVDQAFEILRAHARRTNTSLRSLAGSVVDHGLRLPPPDLATSPNDE